MTSKSNLFMPASRSIKVRNSSEHPLNGMASVLVMDFIEFVNCAGKGICIMNCSIQKWHMVQIVWNSSQNPMSSIWSHSVMIPRVREYVKVALNHRQKTQTNTFQMNGISIFCNLSFTSEINIFRRYCVIVRLKTAHNICIPWLAVERPIHTLLKPDMSSLWPSLGAIWIACTSTFSVPASVRISLGTPFISLR